MYHSTILSFLSSVGLFGALAAASGDCVLLGPEFPSPKHLSGSATLKSATAQFEKLLGQKDLGLLPNDTAWGVALFSSKEDKTLYEHYYAPSNISVKTVNKDSIFRVGSLTKVFTVWSFLIEIGDEHFNDPITKYVPELAGKSGKTSDKDCTNEPYDDISTVQWEDVTLGELASYAAGITRDCMKYIISVTPHLDALD